MIEFPPFAVDLSCESFFWSRGALSPATPELLQLLNFYNTISRRTLNVRV